MKNSFVKNNKQNYLSFKKKIKSLFDERTNIDIKKYKKQTGNKVFVLIVIVAAVVVVFEFK